MKILESYKEKINGTLSFFDRIIINGYLLCLQNPRLFLYYLIQNNIKLTDFSDFSQKMTNELCEHIEEYSLTNGVKVRYIPNSSISIGDCAKEALLCNPYKLGLIAAFSNVELCRTMSVCSNRETKKLEVISRNTKCKWYYLYYNDAEFGWMFIKIQTWFPFNVQVYINGREYLSKEFDKAGIEYTMFNNSFSWISDFNKAQEIADKILDKKLSSSFDGMINKINPHMDNIKEKMNHSYYWCLQECEFATDITFNKGFELSAVFKKLVETTFYSFSCEDVYSFFGRNIKYMWKYNGDIITDLRNRYQGYRIKFKIKENQVKMYDKGNSLRIEVTINDPKEFKVLKDFDNSTGEELRKKKWVPMGKSIANLYRYAEISEAIIKRLLNALPDFELPDINLNDLETISRSVVFDNRTYSAFNVYDTFTLSLFKAISSGSFLINGFTNKSIRVLIFNDPEKPESINKMTRLLRKLKAHKIIKKVHKANKYYLTDRGRKIANSLFAYINFVL